MNKLITCVIILCISLTGCSKTAIDVNDLAMQDKVQATENKCWDAQKPMYSNLPPGTVALLEMSRNNNITLMTVLGTSPCSKTSAFDVQIVELEKKNEVAGKIVGVTGDVIKMGLGVYGAIEMTDKIVDGAGIKVTGDGNATTYGKDQADVVGGSPYVDKSGSANNESNVDSVFTDEKDSRNVISTNTETTAGDANQL